MIRFLFFTSLVETVLLFSMRFSGCGTGVLSIGAAILGAGFVTGFDIDDDALNVCKENFDDFKVYFSDVVHCDVTGLSDERFIGLHKKFDVVVMNPPFGTKHNWGIDMKFLKSAIALSNSAIYSLHKTSTREHIMKKADDWGLKAEVVAELRYDLKGGKYKHHKKQSVDIEVDFYRFKIPTT